MKQETAELILICVIAGLLFAYSILAALESRDKKNN